MMRLPGVLLLSLLLAGLTPRESLAQTSNAPAADQPSAPVVAATLEQRAQDTKALFCDKPSGFEDLFGAGFLKAVPPEQMSAIFQQIYQQAGACTRVTLVNKTGANTGEFELEFEKGFTARSELAIDPQYPNRITGFLIRPLTPTLKSFDAVVGELKKLPGKASLAVAKLTKDGPELISSYQPDDPLALGSAFKLYVLAELVREIEAGTRKWDDVVHLDESSLSLPSGQLQSWPVGSPLTLHTLAALMISQSDNTATDEMIHTLGREKVESALEATGMANPQLDIPFLTTLELFRLKGSPFGKDYASHVSVEGRRTFLTDVASALPKNQISLPDHPVQIDTIEWFASANDLTRVMAWLAQETAKPAAQPAKEILKINPGLPLDPTAWPYVGYKGGSETGVLNLTFWLTNAKGDNFAVALTWNNPDAAVDEKVLLGIAQRTIDLLATPSP